MLGKNNEVATRFIYAKRRNPLKAVSGHNANYLDLYRFVHTTKVEKDHQRGLKKAVWTINTKEAKDG